MYLPDKREQDREDARAITFVWDRLSELERVDPDAANVGREALDACVEKVDCTGFGQPPDSNVVRGAVSDMALLKRLARNWADHPDFLPEWRA